MATNEIEALRAKVEAARAVKTEADITLTRAEIALREAEGDVDTARFLALYVEAQEGKPGAHEAFMAFSAEQKARRVLLGETTLDDYTALERSGILAAIERLRETKPSEAQP